MEEDGLGFSLSRGLPPSTTVRATVKRKRRTRVVDATPISTIDKEAGVFLELLLRAHDSRTKPEVEFRFHLLLPAESTLAIESNTEVLDSVCHLKHPCSTSPFQSYEDTRVHIR